MPNKLSTEKYPFRVKYKGYTITQKYGEVIISDINRRELLTIQTKKQRTLEELCELLDFNAALLELKDGG